MMVFCVILNNVLRFRIVPVLKPCREPIINNRKACGPPVLAQLAVLVKRCTGRTAWETFKKVNGTQCHCPIVCLLIAVALQIC